MTKLWIRVDADAPDDPAINDLADRLGVDPMQALGHCMAVWGVVAKHATSGDVSSVADTTLERWARWTRRRGAFAPVFRELFLDAAGELHGWNSRQGALITRMERDRKRHKVRGVSAESDGKPRGVSAEIRRDSPSTVRNGTVRNRKATPKATTAAPVVAELPAGEHGTSPIPTPVPPASDPAENGGRSHPTWLQVVGAEYESVMGAGSFPWGKAGKALKPLAAHHLPEKIAENLYVYLMLTDTRFLSLTKFAETFGEWNRQPNVIDGVMTEFGDRMASSPRLAR